MLIALVLMAVSIPVASKLVQNNQENRGKAAEGCTNGSTCRYAISDCGAANYQNGTGTCSGGKCCGPSIGIVCTASQKRCSGMYLQVCNTAGTSWVSTYCANGCESNACKLTSVTTPTNAPDRLTVTPTRKPITPTPRTCSSSNPCPSVWVCSNGICKTPLATPTRKPMATATPTRKPTAIPTSNCTGYNRPNGCGCGGDIHCASRVCVNGKCLARPTPTIVGGCGQLYNRSNGCGCGGNSNCASSYCVNGICRAKPTPTVKVCRSNIDYDGNGVINSLDMLKCAL